jgi:hypothetical protein
MTDTDQNKEDEVLKRMLATPHKKHEPLDKQGRTEARPSRSRKKDSKG